VIGAVRGSGLLGWIWAANVTNTIGAIGECIWVWSNERFFSSAFYSPCLVALRPDRLLVEWVVVVEYGCERLSMAVSGGFGLQAQLVVVYVSLAFVVVVAALSAVCLWWPCSCWLLLSRRRQVGGGLAVFMLVVVVVVAAAEDYCGGGGLLFVAVMITITIHEKCVHIGPII
jgi:hypothetical protein